jgi:hypothetical protein
MNFCFFLLPWHVPVACAKRKSHEMRRDLRAPDLDMFTWYWLKAQNKYSVAEKRKLIIAIDNHDDHNPPSIVLHGVLLSANSLLRFL